ncbi:MAG: HEAT repeat domain-containing protein [Deltaproteobacteria bacterium]|nr:HEAT repeat domain-containing protein [Deltaproteobacteria bacterium]
MTGRRHHIRKHFFSAVCVFLALTMWLACGRPDESAKTGSLNAESVLFGGDRCSADEECASGSCSFGMCNGFLMSPTDAMRAEMAPKVRRVARDPRHRDELVNMLAITLKDKETDPYLRGRAADACALLPSEIAIPMLVPYLEAAAVPVRFFAARSLHRLGDARGTKALRTFLEHPSQAVRMMARQEFGDKKRP